MTIPLLEYLAGGVFIIFMWELVKKLYKKARLHFLVGCGRAIILKRKDGAKVMVEGTIEFIDQMKEELKDFAVKQES